jgi:hypothetical protein
MNSGTSQAGYSGYSRPSSSGSNLTEAVVDTMVRWPMRVTGATVDFMLEGVRQMTGGGGGTSRAVTNANGGSVTYESSNSSSGPSTSSGTGSSWTSMFSGSSSGTFDQDLSGDDLKYVIWSLVFTKPGYECILQKQQEELVNYAADSNTYAAVKIARFLDGARHGHNDKPEAWNDLGYPGETSRAKPARKESTTVVSTPGSTTIASTGSSAGTSASEQRTSGERGDKGWRIPPEDQKFIVFLYKVDRRLQKQEEVTRVERVTVERNTRVV